LPLCAIITIEELYAGSIWNIWLNVSKEGGKTNSEFWERRRFEMKGLSILR
jgi:hypothetical protein